MRFEYASELLERILGDLALHRGALHRLTLVPQRQRAVGPGCGIVLRRPSSRYLDVALEQCALDRMVALQFE